MPIANRPADTSKIIEFGTAKSRSYRTACFARNFSRPIWLCLTLLMCIAKTIMIARSPAEIILPSMLCFINNPRVEPAKRTLSHPFPSPIFPLPPQTVINIPLTLFAILPFPASPINPIRGGDTQITTAAYSERELTGHLQRGNSSHFSTCKSFTYCPVLGCAGDFVRKLPVNIPPGLVLLHCP